MKSKVQAINKERLGSMLQMFREDKNLSRKDAASAIGCSPACLLKVEQGKSEPRLSMLLAAGKLYGYSGAELLAHYEEEPSRD